MKDSMPNPVTGRAADIAREAQERVAAAWAELIEAAKTEPKARAFLEAFAAEAGKAVAVADGGVSVAAATQLFPGEGTSAI